MENNLLKVTPTIFRTSFALVSSEPAAVTNMADALKAKYENFEVHYTTMPGTNRGEIILGALFRWDTTKEEFAAWQNKLQLSGGKIY